MYLRSADGDQGYPGEVNVNVTYHMTEDNEIRITSTANTTKPTPINLTSHPYFNLAGQGSRTTVYDHVFQIFADYYLPVDDEVIPYGTIAPVRGTLFDFITPVALGERVNDPTLDGGFDHNFCVRGPTGKRLAARVRHPISGRTMEIYTNQPGMQFYTGNFLDGLKGKGGTRYQKHSAFCLEAQNYPDAVNHDNFPDSILRPGSTYEHFVIYRFGVSR